MDRPVSPIERAWKYLRALILPALASEEALARALAYAGDAKAARFRAQAMRQVAKVGAEHFGAELGARAAASYLAEYQAGADGSAGGDLYLGYMRQIVADAWSNCRRIVEIESEVAKIALAKPLQPTHEQIVDEARVQAAATRPPVSEEARSYAEEQIAAIGDKLRGPRKEDEARS